MYRSENKWLLLGKQSQTCSLSLLGPSCGVHLSGHTALRRGCTRMSVPNQGRVSVIIKPAPEKHPSLQGPVAHFCKEPKMLLAFAKLPPPQCPLYLCKTLHCSGTCHHVNTMYLHAWSFTFSISSFEPGYPAQLLGRGCCLKEGREGGVGVAKRQLAVRSGGISDTHHSHMWSN